MKNYIVIFCIALFLLTAAFFCYQLVRYLQQLPKAKKLSRIARPLEDKREQLERIRKEYEQLQSDYHADFSKLSSLESFLSRYNLGVGTTDRIAYGEVYGRLSLQDLQSRLSQVKEKIKQVEKSKQACICTMGKNVTVNGRRAAAKTLFNREIKLRLRCFNNEVKSAIALADWNNVNRLEARIQDTYDEINSSGAIVKTHIQPAYVSLRIEELKLSHELKQLKLEFKEEEREQRSIEREAEREESRIKAAVGGIEKQRIRMEELIQKEMSTFDLDNQEQREILALHQEELAILKQREKRAVSMAQITRAGFVYIISNEKSFGEGIVKIGMTRRVDPNDRVRELGDASVPELFDVHRFYYSSDAPTMERELHRKFDDQRVNKVNRRKEFFQLTADEAMAAADRYNDAEAVSI